MPRLQSALVGPDHQAKSATVAGPWLVKKRRASSASAASRGSDRVLGARALSSA